MGYAANSAIEDWLANAAPEPVLEPELPIVDPHHHLWDIRSFTTEPHASFEQKIYLCQEIVDDIQASGHNVLQTVFAQCGAFYRAEGPEAMKCVGETEFVHGIYAMSNSGIYGPTRLCTGIFASADLRLGAEVEPEVHEYDVAEGDVLLLCSDGLTEMVGSHEMAGLLNACQPDLAEAARRLIDMANEAGGRDNISVVLVRVLPSVAG